MANKKALVWSCRMLITASVTLIGGYLMKVNEQQTFTEKLVKHFQRYGS